MMTNMTWNEFCELYYASARNSAEVYLRKMLGGKAAVSLNGHAEARLVDVEYVRDAAVLKALEKAYKHFDASKGVKITTYLSKIIHNEIVDELEKAKKEADIKQDIDDVKSAVGDYVTDDSVEARARLVPRLVAAIAKLSSSDQVILNYYLEDKSTYVENASRDLNTSKGYISVRKHRILHMLPTLMELTPAEYRGLCYDAEPDFEPALASLNKTTLHYISFSTINNTFTRAPFNPIMPSINLTSMAEKLLAQLVD